MEQRARHIRTRLHAAAHQRWLYTQEIVLLLNTWNILGFSLSTDIPTVPPASGSLMLVDRSALSDYRHDGHSWKMRKDRPRVREDHTVRKLDGEKAIISFTAHHDARKNFKRKVFTLYYRRDDGGKGRIGKGKGKGSKGKGKGKGNKEIGETSAAAAAAATSSSSSSSSSSKKGKRQRARTTDGVALIHWLDVPNKAPVCCCITYITRSKPQRK